MEELMVIEELLGAAVDVDVKLQVVAARFGS